MVDIIKSLRIGNQFPQFFDFEGSQLVSFMQYYYEWMETLGPDFYSRRILSYNDIDFQKDNHEFFDEFLRNEFMKFVPKKLKVDDRFLIKSIKDFYKAKGTEDAVKILFRILYNEEVEFEYPGRFILRASDGRWKIEQSMKVVLLVDSIDEISLNDFFVGGTSKASAKIQKIEQKLISNVLVTEVFITNKFGSFTKGEILKSRITGKDLAILVNQVDAEIIYPGEYITTDGFLSWDRVLQDNYYYQDYSYVIKSARDSKEYGDILKTLTHPAGTLFFTEYSLRIDINSGLNAIERNFIKAFQVNVDMQDFIQFSLESDVQQGSFSGRYILEYDVQTFNWELQYSSQSVFGGAVSGMRNFVVSPSITGLVEEGDIVKTLDPATNRVFNLKIKTITSPNSFTTFYNYPYGNTALLYMKFVKPDLDDDVSYQHNLDSGTTNITVMNMSKYPDLNNMDYHEVSDLTYNNLLENRFIKIPDRSSKPIVPGSILSVKNNINNPIGDFYVKNNMHTNVIGLFDVWGSPFTTNLNYKVTNV